MIPRLTRRSTRRLRAQRSSPSATEAGSTATISPPTTLLAAIRELEEIGVARPKSAVTRQWCSSPTRRKPEHGALMQHVQERGTEISLGADLLRSRTDGRQAGDHRQAAGGREPRQLPPLHPRRAAVQGPQAARGRGEDTGGEGQHRRAGVRAAFRGVA